MIVVFVQRSGHRRHFHNSDGKVKVIFADETVHTATIDSLVATLKLLPKGVDGAGLTTYRWCPRRRSGIFAG